MGIEHLRAIQAMDPKSYPMGLGEAKPKLGTGGRFKALKGKLAKKGVKDPAALAATIGRNKYGAKKMAKWSAAGNKRAKGAEEAAQFEMQMALEAKKKKKDMSPGDEMNEAKKKKGKGC